MGLAEGSTYLEFLTDGKVFLRTYNLKTADAPTLTYFERNEISNRAEIDVQFTADKLGELLLSVFYNPMVEVRRFLIIVIENL